jgi:hypothetical protein
LSVPLRVTEKTCGTIREETIAGLERIFFASTGNLHKPFNPGNKTGPDTEQVPRPVFVWRVTEGMPS